jgi:threonyl-tRNA synthetase
VKVVLNTLGIKDYRVRVGLRDADSDKYVGDPENWDRAENALREAASSLEVPFTEESGEAAFYGPKIDFVVKDVIGREWQLGTVQVDYNLPERFDLSYIGPDNKPHRPVMIHRAPFGSLERFVAVLIEHFEGSFPTWLAPEQVRILPISEKFTIPAKERLNEMLEVGARASMDNSAEKIGAKIRLAQLDKVPYMLIIGANEVESNTISVRHRSRGDIGSLSPDEFINNFQDEVRNRAL